MNVYFKLLTYLLRFPISAFERFKTEFSTWPTHVFTFTNHGKET